MIITSMDLVTSLLAGFVIFTTFGYMAKEVGSTISEVTKSGQHPSPLLPIPAGRKTPGTFLHQGSLEEKRVACSHLALYTFPALIFRH